jgi:hypothetical protein
MASRQKLIARCEAASRRLIDGGRELVGSKPSSRHVSDRSGCSRYSHAVSDDDITSIWRLLSSVYGEGTWRAPTPGGSGNCEVDAIWNYVC